MHAPMNPPRLVALDDDPASAELIVQLAERSGYEAKALTGSDGLADLVVNWRPDVITLDLAMPEVNGFGALTLLNVMAYGGTLVIISGTPAHFRATAKEHAIASGLRVAAEMQKPVDGKAFRALLESLKA